jgi:hypothetical protein
MDHASGIAMGIVKIDEALHDEVRKASSVMCRSINAQAEFWMKIGMLAEANPTLSFNDIVKMQLEAAERQPKDLEAA